MRSNFVGFVIAFLITFLLAYGLLFIRIHKPIDGVTVITLNARCQIEYYDNTLQPINTLVLSCPRMDMIRLWPLPVVHPWFEDWYEEIQSIGENA